MPKLKSAINRYLDVGRRNLTLRDLDYAVNEDINLAIIKLKEWEIRGWVRVTKDPLNAQPDDLCVEVIAYIDDEKPWSDPWSGKM